MYYYVNICTETVLNLKKNYIVKISSCQKNPEGFSSSNLKTASIFLLEKFKIGRSL